MDQEAGFQAQIKELTEHGCEEIFAERVSSIGKREKLDEALRFIRKKDTLVVTKLDRLARSIKNLVQIVDTVEKKGASLRVLGLNLDTGNSSGRLMLHMMGAIAQFEREIMLERQREGIAKAKADGKYKGRLPTARVKAPEVHLLAAEGLSQGKIAARLGISKASVHRILKPPVP